MGGGDGLELAVGPELQEQALDVAAARVDADAEPGRGTLRVDPRGEQLEDLLFVDRQSGRPVATRADSILRLRGLRVPHRRREEGAVDDEGVGGTRADRVEGGGERCGLRQQPVGAGLEGRAEEGTVRLLAGEQQHGDRGVPGPHENHARQAVGARQLDIDEHHVGQGAVAQLEGLVNAVGRSRAGQGRVCFNRQGERVREGCVIVDDHDLQHPAADPAVAVSRLVRPVTTSRAHWDTGMEPTRLPPSTAAVSWASGGRP